MTNEAHSLLESKAGPQWKEVGVGHHHGITLPLFSLRTFQSCGIGEFTDLLPLLNWCKSLGLDVIQLLPLNESIHDWSPYSAFSANALNPLHIGLAHLPYLELVPQVLSLLADLQKMSLSQKINYPFIHSRRNEFLSLYYARAGSKITSTDEYQNFIKNQDWLESYALFKALKEETQWQSWLHWPQEWKHPTDAIYRNLLQRFKKEVDFHAFVQYLCYTQLKSIKEAAQEKNILIKGDIPILINRESSDVWHFPSLFDLNLAAGAPPDMYAKEGQKWGFPLYNWSAMEQDHYNWWKQRLHAATPFYHLYRIDHIVGFFRIWGIPYDRPAKEGHFLPADESQWIPQGENIMKMMLENCPMLPIGEDLGTVPPNVRRSLKKLGICGTKVMRWERDWEGDRSFIPPQHYPVESMTTVSTHDSETLTLWWRNNPEEAKEFAKYKKWHYAPSLSPEQLKDILWDSHHTSSLFHINLLQEYLALVPHMTWENPEDERINIPGIYSDQNWTYRFRPYVEEIVSSSRLAEIIRTARY
jgi:4-alpha-glucanotransferase